jgi:hypothetical protein
MQIVVPATSMKRALNLPVDKMAARTAVHPNRIAS